MEFLTFTYTSLFSISLYCHHALAHSTHITKPITMILKKTEHHQQFLSETISKESASSIIFVRDFFQHQNPATTLCNGSMPTLALIRTSQMTQNISHASCTHFMLCLLCFIRVWYRSFHPYPSGLLHKHWGNHRIPNISYKSLSTDDKMTTNKKAK